MKMKGGEGVRLASILSDAKRQKKLHTDGHEFPFFAQFPFELMTHSKSEEVSPINKARI
jgi:hypothetical protein